MNAIALTQSQNDALNTFRQYLLSSSQVFILKGAAGTGKTTLVLEFLKELKAQSRDVRLMAPTGRAAHILGSKTAMPAYTIHRGIYSLASLKTVGDSGEADIAIHAKYGLRRNDDSPEAVYVIDESSMVSDAFSENEAFSFGSGRLLSDLFQYAKGRKLVFVGDYAQLPPVGMNFSPALDKDYVQQAFGCQVVEHCLREVMRQADGSMMLTNATQVRDYIENKSFIEFQLKSGHDTMEEDNDLLCPYFQLSETKPCVGAAIIAYSNRQALAYNLAIRRHYFGDNAPRLKAGDLLMIARNNYAYDAELFNGNIVRVDACAPDAEVEFHHVRVKQGSNKIAAVDLAFRKATICFGYGGKAMSLNVTLLDNFLDAPSGSFGGNLAQALVVDFENRLPQRIKDSLPEIKSLLRKKEALSATEEELCAAYANMMRKDPYYNAVICKYGYALTCHKAQGGEWDNVFVDMCRYGGTANEDYFRWAYTAITRASKKLWHYRSPDFNYISNLVVESIQQSTKIKVSVYSSADDFRSTRFGRIEELCLRQGIAVTEDKSIKFQHRLTFVGEGGEQAVYSLWYYAKGYSDKDMLISASDEEFADICRKIITDTFAPAGVPFSAPDRPFAEKLVSFMKSQLEEIGIQLLNITQEQYQDVFHLKTDGTAKVGLFYNDSGSYTYMRLQSSLGAADKKLEELRNRFI